ncbi:MAG: hypothetical protein NVS1B4_18490 [Gemmatimonadaceae bacterium]
MHSTTARRIRSNHPLSTRLTMLLAAATAALAVGCSDPSSGPSSPTALRASATDLKVGHSERTSPLGPILAFVEGPAHLALTPSSPAATLVYESRKGNALRAPDGHQLTLGEFLMAKGTASLECEKNGTEAEVHVSGLVPNGVYTIWTVTWKSPGFDGTDKNLIGVGSLGPRNGSQNAFRATANGKGEVEAVIPAGPLSMFGSVGACVLTSEFETHIVGVYHMDGKSYGPDLGPDGTLAEQFGAVFLR